MKAAKAKIAVLFAALRFGYCKKIASSAWCEEWDLNPYQRGFVPAVGFDVPLLAVCVCLASVYGGAFGAAGGILGWQPQQFL
ncbi:MAG TPA: hypothetical protein H9731_02875 [Candidatus Borkfalkia excrementipullorum]|nr:hypothetical protein [Candidatus Borkfalkia excrementipullorum]